MPEVKEWHKLAEIEAIALQRHLDRIRRVAAIPSRDEQGDASEEERPCRGRRGARRSETRQELLSRLLDPTLTLDETARMLDVCPTTVRRYTNRGILQHERSRGNQRRFKLSCVLAFMEAQARVGSMGRDLAIIESRAESGDRPIPAVSFVPNRKPIR